MGRMLWCVSMPSAASQAQLLAHSKAAAVDTVCIRTDNALLAAAIPAFHAANVKVFGWRWPAVTSGPHAAPHYFAQDEADYVVETLMTAGLDGYIADIEADAGSAVNNWNSAALQPLAEQFCSTITDAVQAAVPTCPGPFTFGLTAGCRQPTNDPAIPWATFVGACDVLFPQAYWRMNLSGVVTNINGGTPAAAHALALAAWEPIAAGKPLECMAGELDLITPAEVAAYGGVSAGQASRYYYCDGNDVTAANLAAISAT